MRATAGVPVDDAEAGQPSDADPPARHSEATVARTTAGKAPKTTSASERPSARATAAQIARCTATSTQ